MFVIQLFEDKNNKQLKVRLELFKNKEIRKVWSEKKEERNETATICSQLKMKVQDDKMRETDVANIEGILRIIQSIPSPNDEPFKLWLASVGNDRIEEINDPEQAIVNARERAYKYYKR